MALFRDLRYHRKRMGLSQRVLANQLGVGQRTYQRWENGECSPCVSDIQNVADTLGVDWVDAADALRESVFSAARRERGNLG